MPFYQINYILFSIHLLVFIGYLIVIFYISKQTDILKPPNNRIFLSIKHLSLLIFTFILLIFEFFYLNNFAESKRDNLYMIITAIQQIVYSFILFLYIKKMGN